MAWPRMTGDCCGGAGAGPASSPPCSSFTTSTSSTSSSLAACSTTVSRVTSEWRVAVRGPGSRGPAPSGLSVSMMVLRLSDHVSMTSSARSPATSRSRSLVRYCGIRSDT